VITHPVILTIKLRQQLGKSFKAFWKQTNYKEDLLERIEAIETRVSDFNDTASRCAMSTLKDVDQRLALGRQEASVGFKDREWHAIQMMLGSRSLLKNTSQVGK
jgi:predicted  nucleic acid-binding Zn-ribbon protein